MDKDGYVVLPFELSEKVRDEMTSALWVDNPEAGYTEVKFPARKNKSKASRRSDSQAMILAKEEVINSADFRDLCGTIEELDGRKTAMTNFDGYLVPVEVAKKECDGPKTAMTSFDGYLVPVEGNKSSRPSSALRATFKDQVHVYAKCKERDRIIMSDRTKIDKNIHNKGPENIRKTGKTIYNNDPEEIHNTNKAEIDNSDKENIYVKKISNHVEKIYFDPDKAPPKVYQNKEVEEPAYMTSVDNKPVHPYHNFKLKKSDTACSSEDHLYADLDDVVSKAGVRRPKNQQSNLALLADRESPAQPNLSRSSSRASEAPFQSLKDRAESFQSDARKKMTSSESDDG